MIFPTLPRDCGREQHAWSVSYQCIDKLSGIFHGQMLGNLEALHEIELSAKIDRRREVSVVKVAGIDQELASVDVGAVHPDHRRARASPYTQPRALPAPEIHDAASRYQTSELRDDPLRRPKRKRRKKAVKVCPIFVHFAGSGPTGLSRMPTTFENRQNKVVSINE